LAPRRIIAVRSAGSRTLIAAGSRSKAVKFHALDDAIDWIEHNSEKLLVGAVVVIAGVSFVVVVGGSGGGALLLAPVLVLASSEAVSESSFLAVHP
jgi:hypothetical protein